MSYSHRLVAYTAMFCCLFSTANSATTIMKFNKLCPLSKALRESSGLVQYHHMLWTMADSGPSKLYALSKTDCQTRHRISIKNARNQDWEALTQDKSYFYIGDIGNNNGTRRNLRIYRIDKRKINWHKKYMTVTASIIRYRYPEQRHFKANLHNTPFDAETLFASNGHLYIITKNWRNHNSFVYRLPSKPGKYLAKRVAILHDSGLATDATLTDHQLTILGYNLALWGLQPYMLTYHWPLTSAHPMPTQKAYLNIKGQAEGISSTNNQKFYLSREEAFNKTAAIFTNAAMETRT